MPRFQFKPLGKQKLLVCFLSLTFLLCQAACSSSTGGGDDSSTDPNESTGGSGSGNNTNWAVEFGCYDDPADWLLTPTSISKVNCDPSTDTCSWNTSEPVEQLLDGGKQPTPAAGDVIELEAGTYPHFPVDMPVAKSVPGEQTIVRAELNQVVRIANNPVGGSDTISFKEAAGLTFCNLTIDGDDRGAILSSIPRSDQGNPQKFRDIYFVGCSIEAGYDFEADSGVENKWGQLSYEMGPSATSNPGYIWKGGTIQGVKKEHANYFHNPIGDLLLEDATFRWLGRTAVQIASRATEGPAGSGTWMFRNLTVEDCCLESGGGGSAFSFNGRNDADIILDNVTVKLGANPNLAPPYQDNITGGLVSHSGGGAQGLPNGTLTIIDSHFQVGPAFNGRNSARRVNVNVGEVTAFTMTGTTILQMKDSEGVDPTDALNIQEGTISGMITLSRSNDVVGDVVAGGVRYNDNNLDGSGYQNLLDAIDDKSHPNWDQYDLVP